MFLFVSNPNLLIAIFQILLISLILFLISLFLYRKFLPYYTYLGHELYPFNNPPHRPEPPIDPDILLDRNSLTFHPHHHSQWLIRLLLLFFLSHLKLIPPVLAFLANAHTFKQDSLKILFMTPLFLSLLNPTLKIIILSLPIVNITTPTFITWTPTLYLQLLMNLFSLYVSPLLFTQLIPFVKTFNPPIFIFPSVMFSQFSSKASRRRIISYLNNFSSPPLYKHSSQEKLILNSPILSSIELLKSILIIGLLQIFFKLTTSNVNSSKTSP